MSAATAAWVTEGCRPAHSHAELLLCVVAAVDRPRVSGLALLPVAEGLDDWGVTGPLVAAVLHRHPDLVGIYSMGAGNRGVAATLLAAGRSRDIITIGHELTPFMREALLNGTFDAAINQDAADEVSRAVRTLRALVDGRTDERPDPIRIGQPALGLLFGLPVARLGGSTLRSTFDETSPALKAASHLQWARAFDSVSAYVGVFGPSSRAETSRQ